MVQEPDHEWVVLGGTEARDAFLDDYRLSADDLTGQLRSRRATHPYGTEADYTEWLVHRSILRSHGVFPCAGDSRAEQFCQEIAQLMVTEFGVSLEEAVARINDKWSKTDRGPEPRIWIVGWDIAYHESPEFWAKDIYFGHDSRWWLAGASPTPLPPPGSAGD